jgi:hypothetical protein
VEGLVNGSPAVLTYAACGLLIVVYASGRFNTPPSNRSSTRQTLYWWSCAGYVLSALALFAALSILLQAATWRTALLGRSDEPSLPAPLIATLAMTTLLPSIPLLKRVDEWFLSIFLEWAEIPAEIKRRAAAMTPESFSVSREDVAELRQAYGDRSYGDTLARYLRRRGSEGSELSHYRLTRVVKLHDRVRKLAGVPGYGRFFSEAGKEFAELEGRVADFLRRAPASLALDERLRGIENEAVFEELARERREAFAQSCRDIFRELTLFLARAVLRSETSEKGIVRRLHEAGFTATEPMNLPRFPINSLTVLTLALFLYLGVLILLLGGVVGMQQYDQAGGLMVAAKSAMVRLATIGVTVWLMQRYPSFRRAPGDPPRFFAYVVNGIIATAVAATICVSSHLGDPDPLASAGGDLPIILLTFPLCTALALCCDDWIENTPPPVWLRIAEAAGCGLVMAAGMAMVLIYLSDRLPFPTAGLPGWKIVMVIGFPTTIAMVFGGCVPHIYRAARRAASIRREEASQSVAPAGSLTPLASERHGGREAADAPQSGKAEAGSHGRHPMVSRHPAPGSSARAGKTDDRQAPVTTGESPAAGAMTDDSVARR